MVRSTWPLGAIAAHTTARATTTAATTAAGAPLPSARARCSAPPIATTSATSRRAPSVRTTGASGTRHLGHRQRRQRNAAEGPAPPEQLGEHERAGQRQAPSRARGSDGRGGTEERAGERHRDEVAGWREIPHPEHAR